MERKAIEDTEQAKRVLLSYVDSTKRLLAKVKNTNVEDLVRQLLNITLNCKSNKYSVSHAIEVCTSLLKLRDEFVPAYQTVSLNSFETIELMLKELTNVEDQPSLYHEPKKKISLNATTAASLTSLKRKCQSQSSLSASKAKDARKAGEGSSVSIKSEPQTAECDLADLSGHTEQTEVEERARQTRSTKSLVLNESSSSSSTLSVSSSCEKQEQKRRKLSSTDVKVKAEVVQNDDAQVLHIDLPDLKDLYEEPIIPTEPRVYQMINNIGFTLTKKDGGKIILYKCFFKNCPFLLNDEGAFIKHLTTAHPNAKWNGFCNVCYGTTGSQPNGSIFEEMKHMQDKHIRDALHIISRPDTSKSLVEIGLINASTSSKLFANSIFLQISSVKLRPWLTNDTNEKYRAAAVMMRQENCLAAPYKCMDKRCIFFSSDETLFIDHLKLHKAKDHQNGHIECAYCCCKFDEPSALVKHVSIHHNFDMYSCAFCFYRSASGVNVQSHIHHYHPQRPIIVIETSPARKLNERGTLRIAKQPKNIKNLIHPLKCVDCPDSFYLLDSYQEHLNTHERFKTSKPKCSKCGEISTRDTFIAHFEKCYNIALYQCLWCLFGTSSLETIKLHLADQHAIKLPFYCVRSSNRKADPKQRSSLTVKLLDHPLEDIIIVRKNITLTGVVNADNATSLEYNSKL